ncbi:MAG: DUF359 domain-containing protein [Candidatus Kariarchaeaceae archaeon]
MDPQNLKLPLSLRKDLKTPLGQIIRGTINETIPLLKNELERRTGLLVGVGDVTAEILVNNGFKPEIIITDGYTKREKLDEWVDYPGYEEIKTESPAAEITKDAWTVIVSTISKIQREPTYIHIKVQGEEDLLVLPLLVELPDGACVIYGQPNEGAVIRYIDDNAREHALNILSRMEKF